MSRSDESEYFQELESQGAVVDFNNSDELLKQIIAFWRPEFEWISAKCLARLGAICGKDLLLLNETLSGIDSPAEIDTYTLAAMYDKVRHRYFDGKTADDLQNIRRLAALAQFDLRPRADVLLMPEAELRLIDSFCVKAGTPPRWYFLHSTAAELVLHALWSGMGATDPATIAGYAAEDVIDYFRDAQENQLRPSPGPLALEVDLLAIVQNRLKLAGHDGESNLKVSVMDSQPVQALFKKLAEPSGSPRAVWLCTLAAHRAGATSTQSFYARHLHAMLENAMKSIDRQLFTAVLPVFSSCLNALELTNPNLHAKLLLGFDAKHFLDVFEYPDTVPQLFRIVQKPSSVLAQGLVDALDETRVAKLIQKTIDKGRSVGTLGIIIRELRRHTESIALGEALERKIGSAGFLDLIESNGTVVDLFKITEYGIYFKFQGKTNIKPARFALFE